MIVGSTMTRGSGDLLEEGGTGFGFGFGFGVGGGCGVAGKVLAGVVSRGPD